MIDLKYLRKTTNNDKETILLLINMFQNQLPELKNELENAFKSHNWFALKETAHKAKNSFQIVGLDQQAEELKKLEVLAGEKNANEVISDLVQRFLKACIEVEVEINNGIDI